MVKEVNHGVLGEQPHGQQGQARVLTREPEQSNDISEQSRVECGAVPVVIGIECRVVEVEESEPVSPGHVSVAADGIVLVTDPHNQDHVEGGGGVLEELAHDGLHTHQGKDDGQQGRGGKRDVGVELQHLQQIHNKHEDLMLGVAEQHRDGDGLWRDQIMLSCRMERILTNTIMTRAAARYEVEEDHRDTKWY